MNTIDPQQAGRVWQRVRSGDRLSDRELQTMICEAWTMASTYLKLSRQLSGRAAATLRRLYEQQQANAACLKGIYSLITGTHPAVKALPVQGQEPTAVLRRLYGKSMQALANYEAKAGDGEYGPVFARLADREKDHCRILLELIGNL